jgi:hypothetical protein
MNALLIGLLALISLLIVIGIWLLNALSGDIEDIQCALERLEKLLTGKDK